MIVGLIASSGLVNAASVPVSIEKVSIDANTYVVIVTQGHLNDAEALKHCIHSGAAYIGMIGSRRKIRLIKDKFINCMNDNNVRYSEIATTVSKS